MTIAWFQGFELIGFFLNHPFSFTGLICFIIWASLTYQKFTAEHRAIMKVCGLVPENTLTDSERALMLVNHMTLRQEFDELKGEFNTFRQKIESNFVTAHECQDLHQRTDALLIEIREQAKHHRKADNEK